MLAKHRLASRLHACALRTNSSRAAAVACRVRNIDQPEAIFFDCDGVLVDTEKDGHRVAFNRAFEQKGLPHEWDVDTYGRLLAIGGGKERMTAYFSEHADTEPFKSVSGEAERTALVKEIHELKTGIFQKMIEDGQMPLRPGVKEFVDDAVRSGARIAVCSTSNEKAVQTIVDVLLGSDIAKIMHVYAGDMVPRKKPDPAVYLLAATAFGVNPARCVVIEDSHIGLCAAKAAGMRCVVTTSSYTGEEDFAMADAVFDCIGEGDDANFTMLDLTTPGSFWLNPPLPMNPDGTWYKSPEEPAEDELAGIDVDFDR